MHANLPLRLARSAVFAVVCLTLACVAHWFAGGASPAPVVLLPGGLVVMTIAAALAGRERSPATVIGLLLAAQALLHQLLGPADKHVSLAPDVRVPDGLPQGHGLSVSIYMLLAHLTAALITGWWLARGETALWSVLRRIGTHAVRHLAVLVALLRQEVPWTPGMLPMRAEPAICPARDRVLRHAVIRRGPPVLPVL